MNIKIAKKLLHIDASKSIGNIFFCFFFLFFHGPPKGCWGHGLITQLLTTIGHLRAYSSMNVFDCLLNYRNDMVFMLNAIKIEKINPRIRLIDETRFGGESSYVTNISKTKKNKKLNKMTSVYQNYNPIYKSVALISLWKKSY